MFGFKFIKKRVATLTVFELVSLSPEYNHYEISLLC